MDEDAKEYIEDEMVPPKNPIPTFANAGRQNGKNPAENGADNGLFVWSQTPDDVCLRIRCVSKTKPKEVSVSLASSGQLVVKIASVVALDKKLDNPVWDDDLSPFASEDERFNRAMTWEVEDFEAARCVSVRLCKRSPSPGVKMWWRRVFVDDPHEVDVSKIEARRKGQLVGSDVWNAAHEAFVKQRGKERLGLASNEST